MSNLIPQYSTAFGALHEQNMNPTKAPKIDRATLQKRVEIISTQIEITVMDINERQAALDEIWHECNDNANSDDLEDINFREEEIKSFKEQLSTLNLQLEALIQELNAA